VSGLRGAAKSLFLELFRSRLNLPLAVIPATTASAEEYRSDLAYWEKCFEPNRESRTIYFPAHDLEPYQGVGPHPEISMMRMQALWQMSRKPDATLVVPMEAALQFLPPVNHFQRVWATLQYDDQRGPMEIARLLRSRGYGEKDLVTSRGEFSLRGGILDFHSPAEPYPVRLEFFGNKIES